MATAFLVLVIVTKGMKMLIAWLKHQIASVAWPMPQILSVFLMELAVASQNILVKNVMKDVLMDILVIFPIARVNIQIKPIKLKLWLYNNILACDCFEGGSMDNTTACTDSATCPCNDNGVCQCDEGYTGDKCNQCLLGFFDNDGNATDNTANCAGKL